jgi:ATP-binding cassette subfamily B protein
MAEFLYRQQDLSDCGVACLLSVIQYYKGTNSIEALRRLSGTGKSGTTLFGLYEAATSAGFNAEGCKASIIDLQKHNKPVILHVVMPGNLQHYVVYFGYNKNNKGVLRFEIGDPAQGIVSLSEDELNSIWQSKTCLTLEPNAQFVTAREIQKVKYKWLFTIIKRDLPILSVAACLGLMMAAMSLSMAIFSQKLIDDFLPGRQVGKVYAGLLLVGMILLVKEGISALRQWILLQQGRNFNSRIIQYFFSRLLHLPMPFFDTRKIGDLTARLNDTVRLQRVVTQIAGTAIIEVLVVIVTLSFLFNYSVPIALSTIIVLPFFFFLAFFNKRQILIRQRQVMQGYALTESNYISSIQGIAAIKNHNQQNSFALQNEDVYHSYQASILRFGRLQIGISFLISISGILFLLVLLAYGSSLVLADQLKIGELMATLSLVGSLLPSVSSLAMLSIPVSEASVAINRMYELTGLEIEKAEPELDNNLLQIQSLSIENLSFRFPGRNPLLKSINIKVKKGELIGLTGENGCGKSTLVQLLLKHYQPHSGRILINETNDIESITGNIWRKYCIVVPQQVHLFNTSVLENIAFEDAMQHSAAVSEFLNKHGFAQFFNVLPQGVFTLVGDEGINLSGGQRQLIGIARALFANPQFLILDEATSAMDMVTEKFVWNLLNKLLPNMAILFITHRLHILKHTQRIYVMQQGTISAVGNHHQLMKFQNLYSMYWKQLEAETNLP